VQRGTSSSSNLRSALDSCCPVKACECFFFQPAGAGEAGTKGDSVLLVTGEEVGGRRNVVKVNAEVARLHRILVCVFASSVILFKSLGQQETIGINF
jgi:hypothetical protein